jgi:hypothetical protein
MPLLITELNEDVQYLTEDVNGKKKLFIEGVFLQAGVKNGNGRIYPPPVLEREVNHHIENYVKKNRAMGELNHPNSPGLNLDRVSHMVKECRKDSNDYIGKAMILDTPMGNIAESLIQAGARLGVSSRGTGSLKEDRNLGANIVQDDFKLRVMIDIVADPSAPSAFVNGVMESLDWRLNEAGEWVAERLDQIKQEVHATPLKDLSEKKVVLLESFIEDMLENQLVAKLAQVTEVDPEIAKESLRRARIHSRITGHIGDQRYMWAKAKEYTKQPKA